MWAFIFLVLVSVASTISTEVKSEIRFEASKDVQIDLYTLNNPTKPQILEINNKITITQSNFNSKIPTRIIIHGFQSNGELTKYLTDAYFIRKNANVNIIAINWEKASKTLNYINAATGYVPKIAIHTANFIDWMVESKLLNLKDLVVIGFSLGSHISGITGKKMRSGKLPKIIGLDPAAPLFSMDKPNERLDVEDALYVETVHTSKLGLFEQLGNVSFFCNGGRSQPDCTWDITGKCSHQAAYKYFAKSIYSEQPLIGYKCDSLHDIKEGNCTKSDQPINAVLGGEPGAFEQPNGVYYIKMASKPDLNLKQSTRREENNQTTLELNIANDKRMKSS